MEGAVNLSGRECILYFYCFKINGGATSAKYDRTSKCEQAQDLHFSVVSALPIKRLIISRELETVRKVCRPLHCPPNSASRHSFLMDFQSTAPIEGA